MSPFERIAAPPIRWLNPAQLNSARKSIERLKAGATDYVLKDWLEKLPGVVCLALRETHERTGHQRAQEDLHKLAAELEQRVEERTGRLIEAAIHMTEQRMKLVKYLLKEKPWDFCLSSNSRGGDRSHPGGDPRSGSGVGLGPSSIAAE